MNFIYFVLKSDDKKTRSYSVAPYTWSSIERISDVMYSVSKMVCIATVRSKQKQKHLLSTVGEFNPLDHIKSCCSSSEFIEWRCSKFDPDSDLFDSLLGKFCRFNWKEREREGERTREGKCYK